MQFLSGSGARIYGISTILAFLTGLMSFVSWVAAAMFAGTNRLFARIVWLVFGARTICNLIAIISLGSRRSFPSGFAIASSSAVSILCGYALIFLTSGQQVADPLYFTSAHFGLGVGDHAVCLQRHSSGALDSSISATQHLEVTPWQP